MGRSDIRGNEKFSLATICASLEEAKSALKSEDSDLTYETLKRVSDGLVNFVGTTKTLDELKQHDLLDLSDFVYYLRNELVSSMDDCSKSLGEVTKDIQAYKRINDINKILRRYIADWYS